MTTPATPTDPAFSGERIDLPNGWSIRKCCSKGWVFFEPNGIDAVDHLPNEVARAFAASFSASAGVVPGLERALEIVQEGMRNFGTRFEGCDAEAHIESALNEARKAPRVALPTAQGVPDELRAAPTLADKIAALNGLDDPLPVIRLDGDPELVEAGRKLLDSLPAHWHDDATVEFRDMIEEREHAAVSSSTAPGQEEGR